MQDLPLSERRKSFRTHAIVFVAVMVVLLIINLWTGGYFWVQWVLLGWGIGLLSHWWFGARQ
ncbi:2TM domain-containing protein [Devosia sp. YR412]|uniref:2TM domain-containing protein n=1 Tax=Devosia sp. YR412 TaxID=1881030 RepID=UPI0008AAC048|nr:2TM domain-containing protein [Devosia sp. YR412]SEQ62459.1 2TM domain-containing protein [Devosia sp. YR412]